MPRHSSSRSRTAGLVVVPLAELAKACQSFALPEEVLPLLARYLELLMRWNKVMNLVGARTWRECLDTLLADSFHLAHFVAALPLPEQPHTWDLGAGAGLPGVPLRMLWQAGHYHMVEVREKRALFLATALAELTLARTTVFRGRAEDFFAKAPCSPHMVVSRAFLPWAEVLALVQGQLAGGGLVVFLAREPAPVVPNVWSVVAQTSYTVGSAQRWFWALRLDAKGRE